MTTTNDATDDGNYSDDTERKGYCLHRNIIETDDGPACERCGTEVPTGGEAVASR